MSPALAMAVNRARALQFEIPNASPPKEAARVIKVTPSIAASLPPSIMLERDSILAELVKLNTRLSEIDDELMNKGLGVTVGSVQEAVLKFYKITLTELLSHRRDMVTVRKRQIAMYLAKTLTTKSLPLIGKRFGDRDHTTVLHSVRKIQKQIETDEVMAKEVADLTKMITG